MKILLSGGEDRTSTFNVVEKYSYRANTWSFVPSMQRKRAGSGVAVCDGKIYMAGWCFFDAYDHPCIFMIL